MRVSESGFEDPLDAMTEMETDCSSLGSRSERVSARETKDDGEGIPKSEGGTGVAPVVEIISNHKKIGSALLQWPLHYESPVASRQSDGLKLSKPLLNIAPTCVYRWLPAQLHYSRARRSLETSVPPRSINFRF